MLTEKDEYYIERSIDYINSAKYMKCRAAIHVESEDDVLFWEKVLKHYMPNDSFDFISYTRGMKNQKEKGSSVCLRYKKLGCLSEGFLIAIDSDERYLMQEEYMSATHYVLQTYTYSIENHYCYPATINKAFNENTTFDFDKFLKAFSEIIYPFYIYYLYSKRSKDRLIQRKDFIKSWDVVPPLKINIESNAAEYLEHVKVSVDAKMKEIKSIYPDENIQEAKEDFLKLGLMPDNTYLYIRGHNLFDKLITSIICKIVYKRVNHEYFSQSLHYDYPEMIKIGEDIRHIFLN